MKIIMAGKDKDAPTCRHATWRRMRRTEGEANEGHRGKPMRGTEGEADEGHRERKSERLASAWKDCSMRITMWSDCMAMP